MNRFAFVLFALSLLVAGCKDVDIDPQPPTPQAEVSIEINGLDTKSIDLTLSVRSADMKALDSWGIVYCETSNKEQGKEKAVPSKPTHVGYQMTITGLKPDTDYYIWGWVEDKETERIWTADYTIARTEQDTVPVKLSGTIIGTQYSVDYDNGNAKSTTVNTKNNVFDGGFIPGPFGTGKTVLQHAISKQAEADIVIIAACGERANEVWRPLPSSQSWKTHIQVVS